MFDDTEEEPKVDLTPLIDVIFMLVIFFVMTMTFHKPVLDIVLPSAENAAPRKKTADLVLQVTHEGKIFHAAQEIPKEELAKFLTEHPDGVLNLMIDEKAPFDSFVSIVDVAKVQRGGQFVISTQARSSSS